MFQGQWSKAARLLQQQGIRAGWLAQAAEGKPHTEQGEVTGTHWGLCPPPTPAEDAAALFTEPQVGEPCRGQGELAA